jgi:hypothetical protein
MANRLLVTLADAGFLDPARQLFACVHFNAGWSGDLMLLAHDVPDADLAPFRERGIRVREAERWVAGPRGEHFHPPTCLAKFEVFHRDFRDWDRVVYLDGDMMFWASLDAVCEGRGLRAVSERRPLSRQYSRRDADPALAGELATRADLGREAFNSGLMAFSTDLIADDTLQRLRDLWERYQSVQFHPFGDQPALNLMFQPQWHPLPDFFAAIRDHSARYFHLPEDGLRMIGKHFAGTPRPWENTHPLHAEWRANLARFEDLDARRPRAAAATWSPARVRGYWMWLHLRRAAFQLGETLGSLRKRLLRTAPVRLARGLLRRVARRR